MSAALFTKSKAIDSLLVLSLHCTEQAGCFFSFHPSAHNPSEWYKLFSQLAVEPEGKASEHFCVEKKISKSKNIRLIFVSFLDLKLCVSAVGQSMNANVRLVPRW